MLGMRTAGKLHIVLTEYDVPCIINSQSLLFLFAVIFTEQWQIQIHCIICNSIVGIVCESFS